MTRQLSASAISAFKACPIRYYLGYVQGIRTVEEKESRRIGTNWHKGLEIIDREPGTPCICVVGQSGIDPSQRDPCIICNGIGKIPDDPLAAAIRYATASYMKVPNWADATAWAVEREIIANTLAAYKWFYTDNVYKVLDTEVWFDHPVTDDGSVRLVGKIDSVVWHPLWGAMIRENKSTSKPIAMGGPYWGWLHLDMQSSIYINAARDLQIKGELRGVSKDDKLISGLVHDVWHKATIRPKKLTQAESKKFIEDHQYHGQTFELENVQAGVTVAGWPADTTFGTTPKKTKKNPNPQTPLAIHETPAMFGARLLADIASRPEFYFARKPIPRDDNQLRSARQQVWHLHKDMEHKIETGQWWPNEFSCDSRFTCDYCPICYNAVDVSQGQVPPGFRRLKSFSHMDKIMEDD